MNCRFSKEVIKMSLHPEQKADEVLQKHIQGCVHCTRLVNDLTDLDRLICENRLTMTNPFLYQKIFHRMNNPVDDERKLLGMWWQSALALSVILVGIFIGYFMGTSYSTISNGNENSSQTEYAVMYDDYSYTTLENYLLSE